MITINSTETITVFSGLGNKDVTNADAHVPDRLKVSPTWPKESVQILKGVHEYEDYIKEWPAVKALIKDKILTVTEATKVEPVQEEKKTVKGKPISNIDLSKLAGD